MSATQVVFWRDALNLANDVRAAKANARRDIRKLASPDGRRFVADLLDDPTDVEGVFKIGPLLRSIRVIGKGKAEKWLVTADIRSGDRRVRDLTERQRHTLASLLRVTADITERRTRTRR